MLKFHELIVKEVRKETADTVSIAFDVPETEQEKFNFIPGQYLTLRKEIAGQDVRRSYSICASPQENDLRVAVKLVEGGLFSTFANSELQAGDRLEVMPPDGRFIAKLNPTHSKGYMLFAAGSGITPVISIAKSVLETEPNSHVVLVYGNRNFESIIFREELEGLKNNFMGRFRLFHIMSGETLGGSLFSGRITGEKCREFANKLVDLDNMDEYFLCGPEEMINDVSTTLQDLGVEKNHVHFELFTSPLGKLQGSSKKKTSSAEAFDSKVTIILDGDSFDVNMKSEGDSVLDAALKSGADLPFACKGGVCCTCRAKVMKGDVEMDVNYALEQDELDAGFVLTCQAHPKSEEVIIDFDTR
jgi:ring-1,2-phenylacetyl-CoA epoxidase subunit PaaE